MPLTTKPQVLRFRSNTPVMHFTKAIPLSLYIHIPWCVKKCPYCDFNSHTQREALPEADYIARLFADLEASLPLIWGRPLVSIFIGGGTPSLFSAEAIDRLLQGLRQYFLILPNTEITLEANPGTFEQEKFRAYKEAGINRLSLGLQSLNPIHLNALGRIHNKEQAITAVEQAKIAGFENINVDLMFGLPEQSPQEALNDLQQAFQLQPSHLSWYQLTLEPNTWFYRHPPKLPNEDHLWEMQEQGQALLAQQGFIQYEVSAYTQQRPCKHNQNYWEFGDYLGIGAGAHSKITDVATGTIQRFVRVRHPKEYLDRNKPLIASTQTVSGPEASFEFMLNALRLSKGVPLSLFSERVGLALESISPTLIQAQERGLLEISSSFLQTTALGKRFLDELTTLFLPPS